MAAIVIAAIFLLLFTILIGWLTSSKRGKKDEPDEFNATKTNFDKYVSRLVRDSKEKKK